MMKKAKATTEITPLRNALERLFTFNDIGQLRFEAAAPSTIRLSRLYKQSATFSTTASILVNSAAVERLYASFGTHRHLARINCVCVRVCVSVTASLTIMLVLGKLRVLLLPHKRRLPSDRALQCALCCHQRNLFSLYLAGGCEGECVQWFVGSKLI